MLSTHIMREAERLCDRLAIIHRGRILASGTLDQLHEGYQEPDLEELFFRLISNSEFRIHNSEMEVSLSVSGL